MTWILIPTLHYCGRSGKRSGSWAQSMDVAWPNAARVLCISMEKPFVPA